jgi:hypothetical protein
MVVWKSMVREVHLDNAPNLERLLLEPIDGAATHVKFINVPKLKVFGYFDVGLHQLKIGPLVIKVSSCSSHIILFPAVRWYSVT